MYLIFFSRFVSCDLWHCFHPPGRSFTPLSQTPTLAYWMLGNGNLTFKSFIIVLYIVTAFRIESSSGGIFLLWTKNCQKYLIFWNDVSLKSYKKWIFSILSSMKICTWRWHKNRKLCFLCIFCVPERHPRDKVIWVRLLGCINHEWTEVQRVLSWERRRLV